MKRVGIVCINSCSYDLNYGTLLQSYALFKYLNSFDNINVECINYIKKYLSGIHRKNPIFGYLKLKEFKLAFLYSLIIKSRFSRYKKFIDFASKYINRTSVYNEDELARLSLPYDTLICGSDTIWEFSYLEKRFDPVLFLNLKNMSEIRKIAYSASAGDCIYSPNNTLEIKNMLSDFYAISCREKYTANFIEKLTNFRVSHTVDPVFLLAEDEYKKIMSRRLIKEKYLLFYAINSQYFKENCSFAKKYAKKHNLKFVELSKYSWHKIKHKTFADASPQDFLSLFYYADTIFTNSFHGTCFSIIFRKKFYVMKRKVMKKVIDICKTLGLENRLPGSVDESNDDIEYDTIYKKLKKWIDDSKHYINESVI